MQVNHVAIIMDGNGRWASRRNLPRKAGHHQGLRTAYRTALNAQDLGIGTLTLYGFSTENWNRPADEVRDLMGLLRLFFRAYLRDINARNIRLRFIGGREDLAPDLQDLIREGETKTRKNSGLDLVIAFNYGARHEILAAARHLAAQAAVGALNPDQIDTAAFEDALMTRGVPDPDLLIRTSGEMRLSNFLLWQQAYTEMVFQDVLWPDFQRSHLEAAIDEFGHRQRRFGGREALAAVPDNAEASRTKINAPKVVSGRG